MATSGQIELQSSPRMGRGIGALVTTSQDFIPTDHPLPLGPKGSKWRSLLVAFDALVEG